MTLNVETPRVVYTGSGTRGPFALSVGGTPITYGAASHIIAERYTDAGVLIETLVNGVDYDLSATSVATGDSAATLTIKVSADVLASDEKLVIYRETPLSQTLSLVQGGGFSSSANEANYDKIFRLLQELYLQFGRQITINPISSGLDVNLPVPQAGYVVGWNADGDGFENYSSIPTDTVSVSSAWAQVINKATIALGLTEAGFSAFIQTLINDADQATALNTLGAQPVDADLTAIAALGYTSGSYLMKKTAANTYSLVTLATDAESFLSVGAIPARRQTVLSGAKDSSGFPAFFAAGSGLRLSLDATPTNLRIAFADGANGDLIATLNADAADMIGADVNASARSYIYATYTSAAAVAWAAARKAPQYGTKLDRSALGTILHFEGADASTSIIDEYGNTWTASGNAQIDTAQSSVGSSSLLLDGSGDLVYTNDITTIGDPSTGAFTARGKVRFAALPGNGVYHSLIAATNGSMRGLDLVVFNNAGTYQLQMYISGDGSTYSIANNVSGNITVATNTWYDFAIVYDDVSGHYRTYWNGVQVASQASAAKICPVTIFRWGSTNGAQYINGWLEECVYEPYCLYPAGTTFTPPTTAFAVNGHFYDIDAGIMYEVTSASASAGVNPGLTARQRVFVGEAIAGASTISSVVNYAYQGRYDSGLFAVVNNTQYSKSHNIGVLPRFDLRISDDAGGRNERPNTPWSSDGTNSTGHYFREPTGRAAATIYTATAFVGQNQAGTRVTSGFYRILADRGF